MAKKNTNTETNIAIGADKPQETPGPETPGPVIAATAVATAVAAPRKRVVKSANWDDGLSLVLEFADGSKAEYLMSRLSEEMQSDLKFHGLKQKLADGFAGVEGDLAQAKLEADKVWNNLLTNLWGSRRGTSDGPSAGIAIRAIAAIQGLDVAQVQTVWAGLSKEQRTGAVARPDVRTKIAELRLLDAQANQSKKAQIDLGSLFAA